MASVTSWHPKPKARAVVAFSLAPRKITHYPAHGSFFAGGGELLVIAGPIRVGQRFPEGVSLFRKLLDGVLLPQDLIEAILDCLAGAKNLAGWIHNFQRGSFDAHTDQLPAHGLSGCGIVQL